MSVEQGTEAWLNARCGWITASRFKDVMSNGRGSAPSKTAESYMDELVAERLTNKPASTLKTYAMEWGNQWEPVAREAYEQQTGNTVATVGFRKIEGHLIGGSADGLVGTDGIIEIKCPLTFGPHLRVVESMTVPDEHFEQIQGYMWILNRQWCDFISYHSDFPERFRLMVIRMQADAAYHKELESRVFQFEARLKERLAGLVARWKEQA